MKPSNFLKIALLSASYALTACTQGGSPQPTRQISPLEVQGMLNNDFAVIVDVREPAERAETIEKARPLSELESLKSGFKDKTIVFCCATDGRAKKEAEKLAALGYKTAYFDGLDEWRRAGLPVKKSAQ